MAPHTQATNITIKQQYQPHQWPWNTSNATNSNNVQTNSNNTATSNSSTINNNPPTVNTPTLQQQQHQPSNMQQQNTALIASVSVTPVNKLKRLQPAHSEASGNTRSNSTNTIANGAKRIRTTSVEKVNKSVGTNTTGLSGPPGLVAVGSGLNVATAKKLTQMAIVAASNINHHQQISAAGTTTTTITKNTKNFTASGNADLANANKITAGRATTLKTTTASSTTTATAEAEAEITTTTELMTTTSTVMQQKSIIKTATGPMKTTNSASLEKYLNLLQQQQTTSITSARSLE